MATHTVTNPDNYVPRYKRAPHGSVFVPSGTSQLFSYTEKMETWSFSIPAIKACPGRADWQTMARAYAQLWPDPVDRAFHLANLVCNKCYAQKGRYIFAGVMNAMMQRYVWAVDCMRDEVGRAHFVATMVAGIRKEMARIKRSHFRIHDSGDFFSATYIRCWIEIIRQLPDITFWAPTRSYRIPAMDAALAELAALPNATIRPSAIEFDTPAPIVAGLAAGHAVFTRDTAVPADAFVCGAKRQRGGYCGPCTMCYDAPAIPTAFPVH